MFVFVRIRAYIHTYIHTDAYAPYASGGRTGGMRTVYGRYAGGRANGGRAPAAPPRGSKSDVTTICSHVCGCPSFFHGHTKHANLLRAPDMTIDKAWLGTSKAELSTNCRNSGSPEGPQSKPGRAVGQHHKNESEKPPPGVPEATIC